MGKIHKRKPIQSVQKPPRCTIQHKAITKTNKTQHQKQNKHQNQNQTIAKQHKQILCQKPQNPSQVVANTTSTPMVCSSHQKPLTTTTKINTTPKNLRKTVGDIAPHNTSIHLHTKIYLHETTNRPKTPIPSHMLLFPKLCLDKHTENHLLN